MTGFLCIAGYFVLEVAYGLLRDDLQAELAWDFSQAQTAILGLGAVLSVGYRSAMHKASLVIWFIWAVWLLATDRFFAASWPSWWSAVEGIFFLAWISYLWCRYENSPRLAPPGQLGRNDDVPNPGARV